MRALPILIAATAILPSHVAAEPLPFNFKVDTYRDKQGETSVFALKLEQPLYRFVG